MNRRQIIRNTILIASFILFGFMGWAAEMESGVEGTVNFARPVSDGRLELELASGTNHLFLDIQNPDGNAPSLSSRIRVKGQPVVEQVGTLRLTVSSLNDLQCLTGSILPMAPSVGALRRLGYAGRHVRCVTHLEGQVLAVSSGRRAFVFQDGSGVMIIETQKPGKPFAPGHMITLDGNCVVENDRALLLDPPIVDNDGIHTMREKSGTVFLPAGKHALQLDWFNQEYSLGLEVYYQGPDLPRQRIPDAALFRQETNLTDGTSGWVNGLNYSCFEGSWLQVPDFDGLIPESQGIAANFSTNVILRINEVGLQFHGYVEVPRDGIYTFTTISDDGSLLFMDEVPPLIETTGTSTVPAPLRVAVRQNLAGDQDDRWAQTEGLVTFAGEQAGTLELELSSDVGRMRVEVADGSGASPQLLQNSRVRVTGICVATRTIDDQLVAGRLLTAGAGQIELLEVPAEQWSSHPLRPIGSLAGMNVAPNAEMIVHIRGKIQTNSDGKLVVADGTGSVQATIIQSQPPNENSLVEVLGRWSSVGTNIMLMSAFCREVTGSPRDATIVLPTLVSVDQIKRLPRDEWQRGYPVKIRGVITTVLDSGFFIQDATRSIYARWQPPTDNDVPRVGDFWEIEGSTFVEFAPNIQVTHATRLGTGTMPEPFHPTWDQLINGSLDTEYVEVQGIITAVSSDIVTLLTRAGKITLELPDLQPKELEHDTGSLVRVRGCAIPIRDIRSQQVVPGQLRLANASITVDEPPPTDIFAIPLKHAADLLLFDVRAGALQRVKIAGQIVYEDDTQLFLMDGSGGLRVAPKSMGGLRVGDMVEAVGFADLGGSSPVLREGVTRRTGSAALPRAISLPLNPPLNRRYDATLVCVQARLSAINRDRTEQVLELQSGTRGFVARLRTSDGLLPSLLPGSLLELTGVYAGQGSDLASGREINSFYLMLNSASDIKVLARPSWWTVGHALMFLGGMAVVILFGLIWIALLRRQVEERSNQLAREIRRHEHTERRREMEEERARIARDLHDDLGATLTQIRFLSALESRDAQLPETSRSRMGQVSEKSREMVASLDEIVWAVNPANDSLSNLANYLCHFAEEFFRPTLTRCRLDVDDALPQVSLTSEVRHNLYLAVREALNNIAKHAEATEVWLRIHSRQPGWLVLTIEDNGRGFVPPASTPEGDGLANMRQRMGKIGGRFEFENRLGAGVVCRLFLPVKVSPPPERVA